MTAEAGRWQVDILVLDFASEHHVKRALDQLGCLGTAKATERCIAFIAVGGGSVETENCIVLC